MRKKVSAVQRGGVTPWHGGRGVIPTPPYPSIKMGITLPPCENPAGEYPLLIRLKRRLCSCSYPQLEYGHQPLNQQLQQLYLSPFGHLVLIDIQGNCFGMK
jgi:hypothetical protein